MSRVNQKQDASISFHYLCRVDENNEVISISMDQFEQLIISLKKLINLDFDEEFNISSVETKTFVPFDEINREDTRLVSGIYRSSYSGHSFKNSEKGEIAARSLNLRPFCFVIYLNEAGGLYIGSQYLGNYGGYEGLRNTIRYFLGFGQKVKVVSIRDTAALMDLGTPKSVEVKVSRKSKDITSPNSYGRVGAYTYSKSHINDKFEEKTNNGLLDLMKIKELTDRRRGIAKHLNDNQIFEVEDDEIEGCKVTLRMVNGRDHIVHLLEHRDFATRYPLDVDYKADGHPNSTQVTNEAKSLLKKIISVREDV